jgi:alkanesulfonate monooxygenase SsuD/methylene tetrahydromethanopterin reductase-like flavin-dependent oxidoreductase (luciferase family)
MRTSRLTLATGVTNPVTRHPAAVAGAAATLAELAGGRTILGVGVGESAVRTIGLPQARLDRLVEFTQTLRALLAGETVTWEGSELHMTWPVKPLPIYFASSGPRSLELAGMHADGVVFQVGSDPAFVRYGLDAIARGAARAGREPGSVRTLLRLACAVDDDGAAARDEIRGYVSVAAMTARHLPEKTVAPALRDDLERLKEAQDYHRHGSAHAPQADVVTDAIVDSFAVAGTPVEVATRLRELSALGIDGFSLTTSADDPLRLLRRLASDVLPEVIR